jgi:hypothetical protein
MNTYTELVKFLDSFFFSTVPIFIGNIKAKDNFIRGLWILYIPRKGLVYQEQVLKIVFVSLQLMMC